MSQKEDSYGIIATFDDVPTVYKAAEKLREKGFSKWDIYTPFPVHGLDKAMGMRRSRVPMICFTGGLIGVITGVVMTWYMNAYDYPLIVGGKPYWTPIYPFPIIYELMILLASFGAFFGMFITNRLPKHYNPVFNYKNFKKCSDDKFSVLIMREDPLFNEEKTGSLLESLGGYDVSLLKP